MSVLAGSMSRGKVARIHDLRIGEELPANVDPTLVKDNVIFIDELKGRTIEQYTNDIMQPYIDEYNAKQKRKDRRIKSNYIDWHTSDKTMMKGVKEGDKYEWAHEFVFCYGNHEDYWQEYFDPNTSETRKKEMHTEAVRVYNEQITEFQDRYPHAKILLAVMHADEPNGSLHMHGIVQFQSNQYDRGLETRISISRALGQDGFEYIHRSSDAKESGGFQMEKLFKDFRHNVMNRQLIEMGHDIKEEEHGAKHLDCPTYIKAMEEADAKKQEADQYLQNAIEKADSITYFADKVKEITEKECKILKDGERSKFPDLVKTSYKDTILAKPRDVAILPIEVYESQEASKDISHAKEEVERISEKVMDVVKDTMESINQERSMEDKREIERLNDLVKEQKQIIDEQQKKISTLERAIEDVKEFIRNLNIVQQWKQFVERKKQERAWARSHVQDNNEIERK